jgi:hypothetical protein
MFSLEAPDIMPLGDIAVVNTIKELLDIHTKKRMERIATMGSLPVVRDLFVVAPLFAETQPQNQLRAVIYLVFKISNLATLTRA